MARKPTKARRESPIRLPVTKRIELLARMAVDGDAETGIVGRIGLTELARSAGLFKQQLLRVLNREGTQPTTRTLVGMPDLCRALKVPEYYCLPISDPQVALLDALKAVEDAGGDVGHFVASVQTLSDLEAEKGRRHRAVNVPKPATPPMPAYVVARSSRDPLK